MKFLNLKTITFGLLFCLAASTATLAQNTDAQALIKEGIKLHDAGKYADAIDKYQQALKIDPGLLQAEFEMSYSMYASGKGSEAIPHLQKLVSNPADVVLAAQAADILGSIYDDSQQTGKAIEAYQQGIKLNPGYQRLRYNLALAFLRQKKFAEAETSAIEAIKLEPKHASSQQLYAVALQNQGKDAKAIMAYCSFLLLEPQTKRSALAYQQIVSILQSKYKVTGDKSVNVFVPSSKNSKSDDDSALETAISLSAVSAALETNKDKSPTGILQNQLESIFGIAGELSEKKKDKDFFWTFYADYLYKLSKSNLMPAYAHLISLSANRPEDQQWLKDNTDKLRALGEWTSNTPRSF